jgi:formyl-CoA transferase
MLNANKKGVALDLKQPAGHEAFLRLAERADVLVENFAAGVMDRLGLGYDAVSQRNPRLVYASGSGFGTTGPYVGAPAMDFTIQALVGAMSITGFPDAPPVKCGPTFVDILGAVHLLAGILLALREREQSGRGRRVEVAMFDATVPSLLSYLAPYYELGGEIGRSGNRHVVGGATPYNNFPCLDGWVAILCVSTQHWLDLCKQRWHGVPERAEDWREVEAEVERWTSSRRRDEVARLVAAAGIPSAPVRTLPEVGRDPHLFERGVIREVDYPRRGRVKALGTPIKIEDEAEEPLASPPEIGQHTREVLRDLAGLSEDEIEALIRDRAAVG